MTECKYKTAVDFTSEPSKVATGWKINSGKNFIQPKFCVQLVYPIIHIHANHCN